MWTIRDYSFEVAPAPHTSLSAFIGSDHLASDCSVDWNLSIGSKEQRAELSVFPMVPDQVSWVAPKLELNHLPFEVRDWKALRGLKLQQKPKYPAAIWNLFGGEWEGIKSFTLEVFDCVGTVLFLKVDGVGYLESAPDAFGSKVRFTVEAEVQFEGVHMRTSPDVSDPQAYCRHHLETHLPDYLYAAPIVEELRPSPGTFYGCHVWFKPAA